MYSEPHFSHTCSDCIYLGGYDPCQSGYVDLYVCIERGADGWGKVPKDPLPVARYGNAKMAYIAGLQDVGICIRLRTAARRAVKSGHIDPECYHIYSGLTHSTITLSTELKLTMLTDHIDGSPVQESTIKKLQSILDKNCPFCRIFLDSATGQGLTQCGAEYGTYVCTRNKRHSGDHTACAGAGLHLVQCWPNTTGFSKLACIEEEMKKKSARG